MKLAILSDIHDQVWKLDVALDFLTDEAEVPAFLRRFLFSFCAGADC